MQTLRRSNDRGHFDHGWLKTYHSFSFADYFDPRFMGFGPLRVINEDWIAPGQGFPTHGHRDMEIITYVIEGAIAHKDSTGGEGVIRVGEVQQMSAGSGIQHSEYNALKTETTHLYQIWITPRHKNLTPKYRQVDFTQSIASGEPILLASPNESSSTLLIDQDALVWCRRFKPGLTWEYSLDPNRLYWFQCVKGHLQIASESITAGDAVSLVNENKIRISSAGESELLWFDLAKVT